MSVPGKILEISHLFLCNLEVECFLSLLTVMIVFPVVALLFIGGQAGNVESEGKLWDVLVFKLFRHHPI
jgi:hypothetical protein